MDDCKRCSKVKAVTFEQCMVATTWSEKHRTLRRRYLQLHLNTITSTKTMFAKSKYFLDQHHYLTNVFVYLLIIAAALCNFSACNLIKW